MPAVPRDASGPEADTLRRAKGESINKLRLVYDKASQILILDHGLQQYDVDEFITNGDDERDYDADELERKTLHVIDLLARICTCAWIRRLWALQEVSSEGTSIIVFYRLTDLVCTQFAPDFLVQNQGRAAVEVAQAFSRLYQPAAAEI